MVTHSSKIETGDRMLGAMDVRIATISGDQFWKQMAAARLTENCHGVITIFRVAIIIFCQENRHQAAGSKEAPGGCLKE